MKPSYPLSARLKKVLANAVSGIVPFREVRLRLRRNILSQDQAAFNGMRFDVEKHHFWHGFNAGFFEPETISFYRENVSPLKEVLDIGAWVGPTLMVAYALNAKKIHAVEADPANYQILKKNCMNNLMEDRVQLHNLCISNTNDQIVSFGCVKEGNTSTKAILNHGNVKVATTDILDFLNTKDLNEVNIIKIDIEGAEQNIMHGLSYIANFPDIRVLFSLQIP